MKSTSPRWILATLISIWVAPAILGATSGAAAPLPEDFGSWVSTLAADDMEGRGLGTRGIEKAAGWIEARLREARLKPVFGTSYRQPFEVKTGVALQPGNRLQDVAADDWTPLGSSSAGKFSGEIAFVGYGIEAPPIGYQELAGIDLRGKIALILRYEPQERDDASPFDGRRPSRWSSLRYKVHQARERGAIAVIFVTGPLQDEEKGKLPVLRNDGPESPSGIPVMQVKTSVAEAWMKKAGIDLMEFQKQVDRDLIPRSRSRTGVTITGQVALKATYAKTANVAGMIRGRGVLASDFIVIGAHYDHLGLGGEGSMRPNERAIHNGADDNASGTVAVLLAANRMARLLEKEPNHRTVIFALFSGEEVGLAGSGHLIKNPPVPLDRIVAMINLDMVGALRDNQLTVLGTESASEWNAVVSASAEATDLRVAMSGDGYGPSDQTSFYAARIPVLHLFTGTHERYHTPDDDATAINNEGGAKIAEFTAALGLRLARGESTPMYARANAAPAMAGDSRGYGAYLGTIPDYRAMADEVGGVLLSDVRPGGPADLAGIRGGDRIVSMAGTTIDNLYDMTFALQDHKPGETVDVIVIREGARVTLRATLGSRSERKESAKPVEQPAPAPPATPAPTAPPVAPQPPPPAAASPHGAMESAEAPKINAFYEGRPGKDFRIGAGKPFDARFEGEGHLADIRQLTFGGENAEAYFSPDGTKLIYQATGSDSKCDQQFVLDLAAGTSTRVSSGKGRTTCGYYDWPEGDRIIYASTEAGSAECPPVPDRSQGYLWPVYSTFDLWVASPDGSNSRRLTDTPGYDAEATWCHRGGRLVFTSTRDGDLDLYEMDESGSVRRLTDTPGYDGGAFYSPDCTEIVWRAGRPTGEALDEYRSLLKQDLVRPTSVEIFVMNSDGTNVRQLTSNGGANFCPYFHPDGSRIIFSSNVGSASGREFELWMIDKNGGEPERITNSPGFDGFPQFSPDGEWIVWASNRSNPRGFVTNLFIARWVE